MAERSIGEDQTDTAVRLYANAWNVRSVSILKANTMNSQPNKLDLSETLALMRELPALSIRQPWASSILLGDKRHENRGWQCPSRFRGRFLIHAALKCTQDEIDSWCLTVDVRKRATPWLDQLRTKLPALPPGWHPETKLRDWRHGILRQLPVGGIVGVATVVDVVTESDSPWFVGPWAFVLDDVREVSFVPCRGSLGFFRAES